MRILDTHLHLIYPDRFSYDWTRGTSLDRAWTIEDYWVEAEPLGIETMLHMEVDVPPAEIEAETAFVLGVHPAVVGAIANSRPERNDFPAQLERLKALGNVRGVRRLLQGQPPELAEDAMFLENLRLLPAHGLTFDICVKSHELAVAEKLIPACPDVQFILDHCGNPKIGDREWESWANPMTRIAENPNVVCKVSGILANVREGWAVADLKPYVEHVITTFGWDRVVWGSDYPVVTLFGDLTRWVNATREIISGASADEQARLLHRNAERIYGVTGRGR